MDPSACKLIVGIQTFGATLSLLAYVIYEWHLTQRASANRFISNLALPNRMSDRERVLPLRESVTRVR